MMRPTPRTDRRERGVALVTALLVVAIATIMAVQLMGRQLYDIRRTQNLVEREQAQTFIRAAEDWAMELLLDDRREGDAVDHLNEFWAQPITPPPFEGVSLTIRIEDMQSRLNLNSLVGATGQLVEPEALRLSRLFGNLEVDPSIVPAVADWIDPDTEVRFPDGAEDDYYSRLDPPYRTANQPMTSVTELRLVRDIDAATYDRLEPFLVALPEATSVNVNTASPQVLQTLADGLSEDDAQALIDARPLDGHPDIADFMQHDVFAGREVAENLLSVGSNWFLMRVEVRLGNTALRGETLLFRGDAGAARPALRRQGFL